MAKKTIGKGHIFQYSLNGCTLVRIEVTVATRCKKNMDDLQGKYPVVLSQDLHWGDMDAFQHLNNTVYFRYFEDVRIAYFGKMKVVDVKEKTQIGPILASTRCYFRAPLTYPDTIQIATVVEDIRARRFTMKYLVYSQGLRQVAAEGEGLIVYYDYQRQASCEIPAVILASKNTLQAGDS